jgi:nicotinate phosphoribosyltransferase
MIVNFAERAHNHNWELDPVTRSLLDTDFYKLLMLQFIWKHYPKAHVQFTLFNRSSSGPVDTFAHEELIEQLDHARHVRFRRSELVWLAGNTFYGRRGIFEPAFLEWLERDFRLSDYELSVKNGFYLSFDGLWTDTTMWELYSLSIINELRTRANLKKLSEFGLDILYAKAKTKLWDKIERLRGVPNLSVADFGTRRRHSFLWQEYVVEAMAANLGSGFTGTSNAFLAHKHDLEAIGTNAHEIPMVLAALVTQDDDGALKASQYRTLEMWQQTYDGELRIMLPDTFGTTQFLEGAPDWAADWTGQRVDSKDPYIAGDEYIAWLQARGRDPREKLIIASDALDINEILGLHAYFGGTLANGTTVRDFVNADDFHDRRKWTPDPRIRFSAGWGTLLTNDFRGCDPSGDGGFDPISLISKVSSVEGRPAVKLSDNYAKALGPPSEIERYRRVFGTAGVANIPVIT